MTGPVAWWRGLSQAGRFDAAIRASFYVNFALVPLLSASVAAGHGTAPTVAVGTVTGLHAALCGLLMHAETEHFLDRRERPARLTLALGAFSVLLVGVAAIVVPEAAVVITLALLCGYAAALSASTTLWPALIASGVGCLTAYVLVAVRGPAPSSAAVAGALALVGFLLLAYRSSIWMLKMVWELDRAKQVQASLAVAEERLRFARDLHDVVGRTLSVVALKAELAAQLAKRGRAEAVEEMLDVRRIAQDSLAEVRAVVGGYREADLDDELGGARALLASAGIRCRVIGDGGGLPAAAQGALGWVVREATTNVLRHSDARTCTITLHAADPGTVALTMRNDGARSGERAEGERVRFGGGLVGLAERLAGVGGTLSAVREPPSSFVVTATVPAEPA